MFRNRKLGTICYFVSDIGRTEAFYRDVLGLEVQNMGDDGDGHDWLTAQTANGIELIFFQKESRPGNSPIIVFEIAEGGIDDVVAGLAAKGATIVTPVSHARGMVGRNRRPGRPPDLDVSVGRAAAFAEEIATEGRCAETASAHASGVARHIEFADVDVRLLA